MSNLIVLCSFSVFTIIASATLNAYFMYMEFFRFCLHSLLYHVTTVIFCRYSTGTFN